MCPGLIIIERRGLLWNGSRDTRAGTSRPLEQVAE